MARYKVGLWLPLPTSVSARLLLAISGGESLSIDTWRTRCGFLENNNRNSPVYAALHDLKGNGWVEKDAESRQYSLTPKGIKGRQIVEAKLSLRQAELLALMQVGEVYRLTSLQARWNSTYPHGRSISRVGLGDLLLSGSQKRWVRSDRGVHSLTELGLARQPSAVQMLALYDELCRGPQ